MSANASPIRVAVLGDGPLAGPMLDALTYRTPGAEVVAVAAAGSTPNSSALTRAMGAQAVCYYRPSRGTRRSSSSMRWRRACMSAAPRPSRVTSPRSIA